MRSVFTLSLAAALLLSTPAFATETQSEPAAVTPSGVAGGAARFEATVVSVDQKTRVITLRSKAGETFQLTAGTEARNLDQLHKDDRVVAKYAEALALQLKKVKGKAHTTVGAMVGRSPKGKKPGALFEREVSFVADVTAVDAAAKLVTVKGAGGRIVDIKVNDPAKLSEIKVGDQVEGVFLQSLAIVTSEPAKTAETKK